MCSVWCGGGMLAHYSSQLLFVLLVWLEQEAQLTRDGLT